MRISPSVNTVPIDRERSKQSDAGASWDPPCPCFRQLPSVRLGDRRSIRNPTASGSDGRGPAATHRTSWLTLPLGACTGARFRTAGVTMHGEAPVSLRLRNPRCCDPKRTSREGARSSHSLTTLPIKTRPMFTTIGTCSWILPESLTSFVWVALSSQVGLLARMQGTGTSTTGGSAPAVRFARHARNRDPNRRKLTIQLSDPLAHAHSGTSAPRTYPAETCRRTPFDA